MIWSKVSRRFNRLQAKRFNECFSKRLLSKTNGKMPIIMLYPSKFSTKK